MTDDQEIQTQRDYYAATASDYDQAHVQKGDEHSFALAFLTGVVDYLQVSSVLDVGSGTGRAVLYLKEKRPNVRVVGVEPVEELRQIGYHNGLSLSELIGGDARSLPFANGEFDIVCEFGMLHHVRHPQQVVAEMLRVANAAVFISDSNNAGQGSRVIRTAKQMLRAFGLWKYANYIKTRGKGYTVSQGDGLAYSYSVFDNYEQIRRQCKRVHLLNTQGVAVNLYKEAGCVALLGIRL